MSTIYPHLCRRPSSTRSYFIPAYSAMPIDTKEPEQSIQSMSPRRNPFLNQVGSVRGSPMSGIFSCLEHPFRRPVTENAFHVVITSFYMHFYYTKPLKSRHKLSFRRPLQASIQHLNNIHMLPDTPAAAWMSAETMAEIGKILSKCNTLDPDQ